MASLHGASQLPSYWLHDAVARGDIKLVRDLFLDHQQFPANKKVDCPNGTVYYPLHVALYLHNSAAEKLLLDEGATQGSVSNEFRKKHGLPLLSSELEEDSKQQKSTEEAPNSSKDGSKDSTAQGSASSSSGSQEDKDRSSSTSSEAGDSPTEGSRDKAAASSSSKAQVRSSSGGGEQQAADSKADPAATSSSAAAAANKSAKIAGTADASAATPRSDSTASSGSARHSTTQDSKAAGPGATEDAGNVSASAASSSGEASGTIKDSKADGPSAAAAEDSGKVPVAAASSGVSVQQKPRSCTFVECLLEWKADVSGVADHHLGTSWLHETVRHKLNRSLAKQLIDAGAPLDAGDGKGNTALHFSLEIDDLKMCRVLLQLGANMNLYNKIGFTSFACACMNGEAATVDYMITLGADVNGGSRQPLFLTCKAYLAKMMYRHCETGGSVMQDQQTTWRSQWTADKTLRAVYVSIARSLLSHGADPQARDDEGNFPLLAAAESGFHEVIPDLAAADTYRAALAAIAAIEEHAKANSGSVSAEARAAASAAKAAAAAGDAAAKARALQKVPAAELAKAAEKAGVDVTTLLTDVAPSANRFNNTEAVTPMMMAVSWGYSGAVEALVKAGADPNQAAGVPKKQPIFIAAKLGHLDVVNKLVELGADWPHGRAAAIVGNDVVQMLIENYKGPKKLQPSVVVKLLSAAEKRGQQARAKHTTDVSSDTDAKQIPDSAATAAAAAGSSSSSSSKAHEAMMQLLLLEEQEKQQQQQTKAGSSGAAKKNKKKDKKKKKLATAAQGQTADEEGSDAEQELDAAPAAEDAANGAPAPAALAATAADNFAALALNGSTSSNVASSRVAATAHAAGKGAQVPAKAPDSSSTLKHEHHQQQQQRDRSEDQQVLRDLRIQLEKLGLKLPDGDSLEQLKSLLAIASGSKQQQQQQQQQENGTGDVGDHVAANSAEPVTAAAAAGSKVENKGLFVFGAENIAKGNVEKAERPEQTSARRAENPVGSAAAAAAAAGRKGTRQQLAAAEESANADVAALGQTSDGCSLKQPAAAGAAPVESAQPAAKADAADNPDHTVAARAGASTLGKGQDAVPSAEVSHAAQSSSSSSTAPTATRAPKRKSRTDDAGTQARTDHAGTAANISSSSSGASSSMDGSNRKDQVQCTPQERQQGDNTKASEAARRAMVAISGRSNAAQSGAVAPAAAGGVGGGPKAVKHDPAAQVSSHSSKQQQQQADGGVSCQGGFSTAASEHEYRPEHAVTAEQSASPRFAEVLSRQDREASRRSQKLAATAAAAAAAALAGSSKAAAPRSSVVGSSRTNSSSGSSMVSSSTMQPASAVARGVGSSNSSSRGVGDPWATPDAIRRPSSDASAGAIDSSSTASLNPKAAAFQPSYSAAAAAPHEAAAAATPVRCNSEPVRSSESIPGVSTPAVTGLSADGALPTTTTAAAADKVSRLLPPHLRFGRSGADASTSAASSSAATSPVVLLQQQQQQPWAGAGAEATTAVAAAQQQYTVPAPGPLSSGGPAYAPQQQWLQPAQARPAQGAAIGTSAGHYQQSWQQQQPAYTQAAPLACSSVATQPATSAAMVAVEPSAAAAAMPPQQWQQAYAAAPVHQLQPGMQYTAVQPQQQQQWQQGGPPLVQQQQYTSYPSYSSAPLMQPVAAGPASGNSSSGVAHMPASHTSSSMGMPPSAAAAGPASSWGPGLSSGNVQYVQQQWPVQQQLGPSMQQTWQQQQPQQQWQQYGPSPQQWQQQLWQQQMPGVTSLQPQQMYTAPPQQQQTYPPPSVTTAPTASNLTYGPPPPAAANTVVGYGPSVAAKAPSSYDHTATPSSSSVAPGPASAGPGSSSSESVGAAALLELQRLQDKYENMTCCVVCLDHPRSVLLLPCKHLALCEQCSKNLQASGGGGECPVCRVSVVQHISGVYMT